MADFADDYSMGETFADAEYQTVRLTEAVAAGDILRPNGVHAATNTVQARKHAGNDKARWVAVRAGAANTLAEVLFRGTCKLTFGANVTAGGPAQASGGKIIDQAALGNGLGCGYIISDGAADDDVGLVYFDGGAS